MASLSSPTEAEQRDATPPAAGPPRQAASMLVVGFADRAAADYVEYASRGAPGEITLVADDSVYRLAGPEVRKMLPEAIGVSRLGLPEQFESLVIFLRPDLSDREQAALKEIVTVAAERRPAFVCVVSTGDVGCGRSSRRDRSLRRSGSMSEVTATSNPYRRKLRSRRDKLMDSSCDCDGRDSVLRQLRDRVGRLVIFRPGHILSRNSRATALLRKFGPSYPLVPRRIRGCCVDGDELFAAIEQERRSALDGQITGPHNRHAQRPREFYLMGPNRPWRDRLAEHRARGLAPACVTFACFLPACLGLGQLAAVIFGFIARYRPTLRRWNVDTLHPASFRELRSLYNKYNYRYVKVVGYNNGVNHFGHRYPGKTVVSTVRLNRVVRAGQDAIRADCGATIRKARDFLTAAGQDLYVIPNYSYVCLGTSFFVPIHGSAAAFSCVADTISKVVLYDPVLDRLISAARDEPAFRERVYDLDANVLLLRLTLRVKPKASYYVHQQELENPSAEQLLEDLRDQRAANAEVRKSNAAGSRVQVIKYYNDAGDSESPVLELPRDSLGRLWDRLEENPVTSFLMHALTRHLAFHVELFFTAEEFTRFWKDHGGLPLRKIQLRYIKKDGLPKSPFRDHDCVSADTFMFRRNRADFEAYLKRKFAIVRANPGKHSV